VNRGRLLESTIDVLHRVPKQAGRIGAVEVSARNATPRTTQILGDVAQGARHLIDDRKVRHSTRPGQGIQVDRDHPLSDRAQRLGPIAIFEWDDDHIRPTNPPRVDPSAVRR
jgi:hypothetical protein